jgi:hypothetical protein
MFTKAEARVLEGIFWIWYGTSDGTMAAKNQHTILQFTAEMRMRVSTYKQALLTTTESYERLSKY